MISSSVFTASAETREVKAEDDYTLGEVRDILQEYFIENNIDMDDIKFVINEVKKDVKRLREMSPLWERIIKNERSEK